MLLINLVYNLNYCYQAVIHSREIVIYMLFYCQIIIVFSDGTTDQCGTRSPRTEFWTAYNSVH
jgi:hypothetical protein